MRCVLKGIPAELTLTVCLMAMRRGRRLSLAHLLSDVLGGLAMRSNVDLGPYRRSSVGFDRLFDLLESGNRAESPDGYPAYDIEQTGDDTYRISVAATGFEPDEIEIVAQQNQLTVTGRKAQEQGEHRYLHRGIVTRPFEKRFQLADFVEVQEARFDNGVLRIALKREIPEAMKPHRIPIGGQGQSKQVGEG
jgi:molecular chaperone IbpA